MHWLVQKTLKPRGLLSAAFTMQRAKTMINLRVPLHAYNSCWVIVRAPPGAGQKRSSLGWLGGTLDGTIATRGQHSSAMTPGAS